MTNKKKILVWKTDKSDKVSNKGEWQFNMKVENNHRTDKRDMEERR
jgi:hypothetical protein